MIFHLDTETEWRGGQQQAIYLIEGLIKQGLPTLLICRKDSKLYEYALKHNIPVETLALRSEYDIISVIKLIKLIKSYKATILHCHNSHALGLGVITKFFIDIPLLASRRVDFPLQKNIFSIYKYNTKKLDKLICISDNIRKVVEKSQVDSNKLITIRSAIDVSKADRIGDAMNVLNEFPKSEFIIGTVAALTGHKDYPNLIDAAEIVLQVKPDIKFVAIGDGKLQEELALVIKEKKLEKNFLFLGYKQNVYDYLKRFDIFVLASKLEGLGTSVLDALSCGKTIVTTDAGGIPEMIVDNVNGLLVPKKNPLELAKALLRLCDDADLRKRLAREAKESAQLFDISKLVDQHIVLYKRLMSK